MGFAVPDDISIVGWDDSLISQVVHPPLTAITRDIVAYGTTAIRHLLEVIEGRTIADVELPARRTDASWEYRSGAHNQRAALARGAAPPSPERQSFRT